MMTFDMICLFVDLGRSAFISWMISLMNNWFIKWKIELCFVSTTGEKFARLIINISNTTKTRIHFHFLEAKKKKKICRIDTNSMMNLLKRHNIVWMSSFHEYILTDQYVYKKLSLPKSSQSFPFECDEAFVGSNYKLLSQVWIDR